MWKHISKTNKQDKSCKGIYPGTQVILLYFHKLPFYHAITIEKSHSCTKAEE